MPLIVGQAVVAALEAIGFVVCYRLPLRAKNCCVIVVTVDWVFDDVSILLIAEVIVVAALAVTRE